MKILVAIAGYLPFVLAGVMAVEQSISSAPGATKKQLVLSAIEAAAQVGEKIPEAHVAGISALIDSVVGVLNASGIFTHATPVAPQPPKA